MNYLFQYLRNVKLHNNATCRGHVTLVVYLCWQKTHKVHYEALTKAQEAQKRKTQEIANYRETIKAIIDTANTYVMSILLPLL